MPGWLAEVLKLLGFTTPFVYAAATYGIFHWLDKNASGAAKRALTTRLRSAIPSRELVASFTVEVFDKIYTYPLFRWRAFLRSAAITTLVCLLVWWELGMIFGIFHGLTGLHWYTYILFLLFNVITDFASLFFIRRLLQWAPKRPIISLVAAFAVAVAIVYCGFLVRIVFESNITTYVLFRRLGWNFEFMDRLSGLPGLLIIMLNPLNPVFKNQIRFMAPAAIVHTWLPLFASAVVGAECLGGVAKAVGWMQWFLRQGQHHPFQAVGYVAAVIVFVSGGVIQYLWH